MYFEGRIDVIAGSNNFSIQIDDHIAKTSRILDNTVPTREAGVARIDIEISKLAEKHKLFKLAPVSMSIGYR